tara:strand:+ start:1757 stop:3697 length:1941 start_codon:yes stop_codon:yes gene_type:complete
MIGTVEIYKDYGTEQQELLLKENNLVVDGAGEVLCDLFTTPSGSISGVSNVSAMLTDTSNFTIRAFSIGKGSNAYKKNAHFFPKDTSAFVHSNISPYHGYVYRTKRDRVVRAVSEENQNIEWTLYSYDPLNDHGVAPNPFDRSLEADTTTAIDKNIDQAHKMNGNYMSGRTHAVGHNLNRIMSNTNPNLMSYTVDPLDANLGGTYWTSANLAKVEVSAVHSGPFYDTSAWHLSGTGTSNHLLRQRAYLTEYGRAKRRFHENLDHTFSLYTRLPDDITDAPTTVVLNVRAATWAGTVVANHQATFTATNGVSGVPMELKLTSTTNGAEGDVENLGIGATSSHVGWQRIHCRLDGLGESGDVVNGQNVDPVVHFTGSTNPNTKQMFHYGYQLEESFGPSEYQAVSGIRPSFNEGGIAGDIFQGCFPDTSGTKFALVTSISGLDYTDLDHKFLVEGKYPDIPNRIFFNSSSIRSMDQNGFVKVIDPSSMLAKKHKDSIITVTEDVAPTYTSGVTALDTSGMKMSVASDFSSTGEVSYTCTISSGDLGLANMYGGVFKLGLWTIDLKNTMQGNIGHHHNNGKFSTINKTKYPAQPPFNFRAGSNRLSYKLFCEKSFTLNLARVKDKGSAPISGSVFGHSPLTIVWKLKFT